MQYLKYLLLNLIVIPLTAMNCQAGAPIADLLSGEFILGGERAPENRYFYFRTALTDFAKDGTRSPGNAFTVWLEAQPSDDGGVKYISRKFTLGRKGGEEVEIPSLKNWEYSPSYGVDDAGQVFGIDHSKFMVMMDAKGKFVDMQDGYMVYNHFIDFHALSDVLSGSEDSESDISALKRIGQKIVHSAANSSAPVGLGEAMKKGSEFRNGEMTLEFKGVSLVDGVPCALLQYDSGDSSYTMYMEALPGMDMIAQGASHYQGDVYVELGSNWLRKATLYELVVTEVKTNGEATENGIIERESLLKTLTKEEFERL
jgi:hypothetical protein